MTSGRLLRRLQPGRLAGQITFLILASIVCFQTVVLIAFHVLDVEGRRHIVDQSDFIASIILAVDAAPIRRVVRCSRNMRAPRLSPIFIC